MQIDKDKLMLWAYYYRKYGLAKNLGTAPLAHALKFIDEWYVEKDYTTYLHTFG